jgi:hypothetical protein
MAKNTLSKSGSAGGGFRSRQVKEVGNRPGKVAERINPGGVSQIGEALGNHSTENRTVSNYRGDETIGQRSCFHHESRPRRLSKPLWPIRDEPTIRTCCWDTLDTRPRFR